MATIVESAAQVARRDQAGVKNGLVRALQYCRRNPSLVFGLVLFTLLLLSSVVGARFVNLEDARPISVKPLQPPSWALPFGSDKQGRNLLAVMVSGTPLTLRIGLIAGFLGVTFGGLIAFVSAYYGGWLDAVLRSIVDVGLTIPGLMVLIVVAMMVRSGLSVEQILQNVNGHVRTLFHELGEVLADDPPSEMLVQQVIEVATFTPRIRALSHRI